MIVFTKNRGFLTFTDDKGGIPMAEDVLAPMVGKILKIKVKPGDRVQEDDEILVMESMKLETSVHAPCSGVVKEIKVSEGDRVEEDDLLVVIE